MSGGGRRRFCGDEDRPFRSCSAFFAASARALANDPVVAAVRDHWLRRRRVRGDPSAADARPVGK
jgi:hypothetical protein